MQGHGDHWRAIFGDEVDLEAVIVRGCQESKLVDQHACVDVANKT